MSKIRNLLWGIVLIAVGLVLGLNAMGITNINIFFDGWWTLFIIVPCFINLFKENEKTGNLIGLLVGIVLLLCCQNFLDIDKVWQLIFPAILIIIGISFIFKDVFDKKLSENIKKLNDKLSKDNDCCATFSGQNVNYDGEKFEGGSFTAVFGGIKCDLSKAIIDEDIVINASSTFGGIDLIVPEDVNVKLKSSSIFGGVDDKRKNRVEKENAKTIYVNATCLFGGVEVK